MSTTQHKSIQNSQTSQDYIFHILQYFVTKHQNFANLRMLFPTVLMNFSNSKVSLVGEWSIFVRIIVERHGPVVRNPVRISNNTMYSLNN